MSADGEIPPGAEIQFNLITPRTDEECRAQIRQALALGLPEALERKRLAVIAGGPSALEYFEDRKWEGAEPVSLSLNGSLRLFTDRGLAPTYWACCDPQALVADFLPAEPPMSTIYLVASKCHPSVFERLRGRDVRVWHVKDNPVPGRARVALCTSITMSGMWLMHRLGFTDFEIYGWDGCFVEGRHHAGDGLANPGEVDLIYGAEFFDLPFVGRVFRGGRTFRTTKTWAAEAQGAEQFFQLADYYDIGVTVHGDGMMKAVRELIGA